MFFSKVNSKQTNKNVSFSTPFIDLSILTNAPQPKHLFRYVCISLSFSNVPAYKHISMHVQTASRS